MAYISVADAAKKWNLSERSVRNYCAIGKIPNAVLASKTWQIPEDAKKPKRTNAKTENALLSVLREEKKQQRKGGIYCKVQVDMTYNSNHIEGNRLTHDQTRYIFETNTIVFESEAVNVDDVVETANHFRCIDMVIDNAMYPLSETLISCRTSWTRPTTRISGISNTSSSMISTLPKACMGSNRCLTRTPDIL